MFHYANSRFERLGSSVIDESLAEFHLYVCPSPRAGNCGRRVAIVLIFPSVFRTMPGSWFFHYTSRDAAQLISVGRQLRPGAGGVLYLTWDVYDRGREARESLAIPGGPVEVVLVIDTEDVRRAVAGTAQHLQPRVVRPLRLGMSGSIWLRGGGAEVLVNGTVSCSQIRALALAVP